MFDGLNKLDPSQLKQIIQSLRTLTFSLDAGAIEKQAEQEDTAMSLW